MLVAMFIVLEVGGDVLVLLEKVGGNRHSQNEQICHEELCNILNLKKKSFQTIDIFI